MDIRTFNPHTLMLVPSMGCMAECKYCFGPHKGAIMQKSVIDATIDFIAKLWENKRDRKIIFHGGEPLLAGYDWFIYTLERFAETFNNRVQFSIQSNLWQLDQRFIDLFAKYQVNVSTSLDGDKDVCDSQRGNGYFDRTMAGIRLLKDNGLEVSAIATVMPSSIDKIPDIFRFFEREQLPFTLRGSVPSWEHGYDPGDYYVDSSDMEKIYAESFSYMENNPVAHHVRDVVSMVRNVFMGMSSICTFSNCLGLYVAVAPDGNIYTCQRFCGIGEFSIGNVLDACSTEGIYASKGYRKIAAKYEETNTKCGDCRHLRYCNGGCVYSMLVAEKQGKPLPFCNKQEKPADFYKTLFDSITFRLAKEGADVMLERATSTPYLAMAGDKPPAGLAERNKRCFLRHYAWGRTKAPRYAFNHSERTEKLFLNITNNCPLRCSHCSVDASSGFADMPLDSVISVVQEAIEIGYKELSLNGGEPFLYESFPELIEQLEKIPHRGTRFALFTNLYCDFTEEFATKVVQVFNEIVVSLDGDEYEHDLRRGKGAFKRTCDNLRKLNGIENKCKISIRASLTPKQRKSGVGEKVGEIAKELGVESVYIKNVFPIGRAKSLDSVYDIPVKESDVSFFDYPFRSRNSCGIGSNLHITPEGDIYPCWALIETEKPLGNIRDGLRNVTRSYRLGEYDKYTVDNLEKCKTCDVRYICGGICYVYRDTDCSRLRDSWISLVEIAGQGA